MPRKRLRERRWAADIDGRGASGLVCGARLRAPLVSPAPRCFSVRELTGWVGPFPQFADHKISGATFSAVNTSLLSVYAEDETRVWAVGTAGTVVHSGPTQAMTWYQVAMTSLVP